MGTANWSTPHSSPLAIVRDTEIDMPLAGGYNGAIFL
jgi:hypothetical protein